MKRFLGAALLVTVLVLAAACGSGGGEEQPAGGMGGGGDAQEGEAPPMAESLRVDADGDTIVDVIDATAVATPTAESVPAAADLREQLGELVLGEDDVPAGFSSLGSMGFDFSFDFMDTPSLETVAAHMSMFATPESEDMIVSMVILMEDDMALQEAFSQIDDLGIEQLQEAFSMVGDQTDMALLDTRELDVSSLGDNAYGLGLTIEVPHGGTMDSELAVCGEGSLLAVAMTMTMGGDATGDVGSLAETMADKIEAAVQ